MNGEFIQYWQVNTFIAESWPVAVEWYNTGMEYRSRGIANYGTETYDISASYPLSYPLDRAYQYWPLNSNREYSCVFIDLVDNFNQNNAFFINHGTSVIDDQVMNYSLAQIESTFLKYVYGQSSLTEKLKNNKPSGVTDVQIDLLMKNF